MTDPIQTPGCVAQAKRLVRERIWSLLDQHGAVQPPGAAGHIPSFVGADQAAERLAELPAWTSAQVDKSNPDRAQLPVRVRALQDGKTVYMAVPRLETVQPFYRLDPQALGDVDVDVAATGAGAARVAPRVGLDQIRPVDLIVCGSVAVDRRGVRIGKGAGYSDIEVALLHDAGLLHPQTVIVTTVHDLQVVDHPIPDSPHDFRVHLIVTPTQVIPCAPSPPPAGIDWHLVTTEQKVAIPVLGQLRPGPPPQTWQTAPRNSSQVPARPVVDATG
jgi:5-formyltetrahydrofolate cyclo-ligase